MKDEACQKNWRRDVLRAANGVVQRYRGQIAPNSQSLVLHARVPVMSFTHRFAGANPSSHPST